MAFACTSRENGPLSENTRSMWIVEIEYSNHDLLCSSSSAVESRNTHTFQVANNASLMDARIAFLWISFVQTSFKVAEVLRTKEKTDVSLQWNDRSLTHVSRDSHYENRSMLKSGDRVRRFQKACLNESRSGVLLDWCNPNYGWAMCQSGGGEVQTMYMIVLYLSVTTKEIRKSRNSLHCQSTNGSRHRRLTKDSAIQ